MPPRRSVDVSGFLGVPVDSHTETKAIAKVTKEYEGRIRSLLRCWEQRESCLTTDGAFVICSLYFIWESFRNPASS